MRARVLRTFRDARTGETYGKGRVIDLPPRRIASIVEANPSLVEPLDEERRQRKEEPAETDGQTEETEEE